PITTAPSVPWPAAVAAREPYRCTETSATRAPVSGSSSTSRANLAAARIGPTVWELDGPMPILNRSNVLTLITCLLGGPAPRRAAVSRPLLVERCAVRSSASGAPSSHRPPRRRGVRDGAPERPRPRPRPVPACPIPERPPPERARPCPPRRPFRSGSGSQEARRSSFVRRSCALRPSAPRERDRSSLRGAPLYFTAAGSSAGSPDGARPPSSASDG